MLIRFAATLRPLWRDYFSHRRGSIGRIRLPDGRPMEAQAARMKMSITPRIPRMYVDSFLVITQKYDHKFTQKIAYIHREGA